MQEGEARRQRARLIDRMIGAARLQVSTFEDVEADRSATRQAMLVVIVVAVATGIGSVGGGVAGLLGGVAFALVGWATWAWLTYLVGTRLLAIPQTHADRGQLGRGRSRPWLQAMRLRRSAADAWSTYSPTTSHPRAAA